MFIGKQKLSTMIPLLQEIAKRHGLRLHIAREFKMARFILANQYTNNYDLGKQVRNYLVQLGIYD
jgi:hypothetical protein